MYKGLSFLYQDIKSHIQSWIELVGIDLYSNPHTVIKIF